MFIAANIVDEELIRGSWGRRVVELVDLLGRDNVFLSIYENDSGPGTRAALSELSKKVQCECSLFDITDARAPPKWDAEMYSKRPFDVALANTQQSGDAGTSPPSQDIHNCLDDANAIDLQAKLRLYPVTSTWMIFRKYRCSQMRSALSA